MNTNFDTLKKNNGAGGMGGKIQPSAVLVIQNGTTKLVNVKNQDGVTKILYSIFMSNSLFKPNSLFISN